MSIRSIGDIMGKGAVYRELLGRDEWKKFARGIREQRNFCEMCKRGKVELNVHHFFYDAARLPWEYRSDEVTVLCRPCHEEIHNCLQQFRKFVFRKLNPRSFQVLNGALAAGLDHSDPLEFAYAVAEMAASPNSVKRFCAAWHATPKPTPKPEPPPTLPVADATHRPATMPEGEAVRAGALPLIEALRKAAQ